MVGRWGGDVCRWRDEVVILCVYGRGYVGR